MINRSLFGVLNGSFDIFSPPWFLQMDRPVRLALAVAEAGPIRQLGPCATAIECLGGLGCSGIIGKLKSSVYR